MNYLKVLSGLAVAGAACAVATIAQTATARTTSKKPARCAPLTPHLIPAGEPSKTNEPVPV